jgi:flavin reductase (DIM6/NTAB) family NADH-FMN oxidoreductase RutF
MPRARRAASQQHAAAGVRLDTLRRSHRPDLARTFSLMALAPTERVLQRRLQESNTLRGMDIFDGVLMERTAAGLPVVASSLVSMECEIVRHIDLEADHQLYAGRVLSCRLREMMQAAC